jgi:5-hydroxyisourate hydrolase
MSAITTHVLDTARGRPAGGVPVVLERRDGESWALVGGGSTDSDGRARSLLAEGQSLLPGTYRLVFNTAVYFRTSGGAAFFPEVQIVFEVGDPSQHYHIPLLLSPFGYSTYRGS